MHSMTRWVLAGCMALAALGAVAVLDVGSRAADAAPSVSPFAGTYVGADPHGLYGSWTVTISDAGLIASSFSRSHGTWRGTISGQVDSGGKSSLKVYVYDRASGGATAYTSVGKMASDAAGDIVLTDKTYGSLTWVRQ